MGQLASSTCRHDQVSGRPHSSQKRTFLGKLARLPKRSLFHRGRTQPAPLNPVASASSYARRERREPAWTAMVRPRILLNHLSSQQAPSDPAYGRTALLPRNHQTTATTTSDSTNHDISFLTSFQLPDLPDRFGADDIASLRNAIDSLDPREASPLPVLLSLILLSFFDGLTNDMSDTSAMALQDPSPGPSTEAPLSFSSGSNEFTGDISSVSRENDLPSAQRFLFLMRTMGHVFLPEDASYEELLRLDSMLGPRLSATTQAAVDEAIPVTMWSESMKTKLVASNECSVCLDTFVVSQPVRVLKCRHVFHRECVDRWLCEFYNNCPVCRRVPVESTI